MKYLALIVVLLFPPIAGAVDNDKFNLSESPLRFLIIGDRTHRHVVGLYDEIIEEINQLSPDFVISTGDNIEGSARDTTDLKAQWEEYLGIINKLEPKIYFTPGNHDIQSDITKAFFERFIGEPQQSFMHKGVHFLILNNSQRKNDSLILTDSTWMLQEFAKYKDASFRLVFFHRPLWFKTIARGEQSDLHSFFVRNKVNAVFSGHDHSYYSGTYDGIYYTAIGSAGAELEPTPGELDYHYLWVTINDKDIKIAPIRAGSVEQWDETTADDVIMMENVRYKGLNLNKPVVLWDTNKTITTSLTVYNPHPKLSINDTIRWNVPQAWSVNPSFLPLDLPAQDSVTLRFDVSCSGDPYPTPTVFLPFPINSKRNFTSEVNLFVNQTQICKRFTTPPNLDGNLTEWSELSPATGIRLPDQVTRFDSTEFYFAWDDNFLYLAARCFEEDMNSLRAEGNKRDYMPLNDDKVGFYLYSDFNDSSMFRFYFNTDGLISDCQIISTPTGNVIFEHKWDADCVAVTDKKSDFWTLEAKIKLDQINNSKTTPDTWGLKMVRYQSSRKDLGYWQLPTYLIKESFGMLKFE